MEMNGEQLIAVPLQQVWESLNDPEMLRTCIPGCESIEKISDTEFRMKMTAAVGPVKAKFTGKLMLEDLNPPHSYRIQFEGSGGAAGFGKGSAEVVLAPQGSATKLSYTVAAHVGGKLAQVGSRLVDSVARKMADEFFQRFKEKIGASSVEPATALEPPASGPVPQTAAAPTHPAAAAPADISGTESASKSQTPPVRPGSSRLWLIVASIGVLLALAYFLT